MTRASNASSFLERYTSSEKQIQVLTLLAFFFFHIGAWYVRDHFIWVNLNIYAWILSCMKTSFKKLKVLESLSNNISGRMIFPLFR
jgi:hypothetical protein